MTDTIKRALTPEEWDQAFTDVLSDDPFARLPEGKPFVPAEEAQEFYAKPHKVAALCLYGQPFGFTHEDVEDVQNAAFAIRRFGGAEPWQRRLEAIAARLSALLPELNANPPL